MWLRFTKLFGAAALLAAVWGLSTVGGPDHPAWVRTHPVETGPVRILRFYATAGAIMEGEKAQLCYGVENAKSVRISPAIDGVYPSPNRCIEIGPQHTTHYTILAEGFDGRVETRSFTLPVQRSPSYARPPVLEVAMARIGRGARRLLD